EWRQVLLDILGGRTGGAWRRRLRLRCRGRRRQGRRSSPGRNLLLLLSHRQRRQAQRKDQRGNEKKIARLHKGWPPALRPVGSTDAHIIGSICGSMGFRHLPKD